MQLTGSFVLPEDIVLQPVLELSEETRRSIGSGNGDFAISRRRTRAHSKVLDADAATLVRHFQEPSTIAMAVARYSRNRGDDPDRVLDEALPLLRSLIAEGLLIDADSAASDPGAASLADGDNLNGWMVVRAVQSLEDTELYQVRDKEGRWGALKIGRAGNSHARRSLANEVRILSALALPAVPKILAVDETGDRPYLITEWLSGVNVQTAAAELRRNGDSESWRELVRLGTAILDAYAALHEQSVIHGDVHTRNLLVDGHGSVRILDFGAARVAAEAPNRGRAGISFFFEPEFALAVLENRPPPPATFAGEQYALASLLYLLVTGSYTHDFLFERSEMYRQISADEAMPISRRGSQPWPQLEPTLTRALSKEPAQRFRSVREFSEAWHGIDAPVEASPVRPPRKSKLNDIRLEVLRMSEIGGEWMRDSFKTAPTVSVNHGSAGLAYGLYRIACCTDDGELLATADAWSERSVREMNSEAAFYNEKLSATPATIGKASLYHQPPGVYVTQAAIASSRGDETVLGRAAEQFVDYGINALRQQSARIDLTLGLAGALLGSSFLLDTLQYLGPATDLHRKDNVRAFGHKVFDQLWATLAGYAPVGDSPGLEDTGVAHGWGGILYASLCWCGSAGVAVSPSLYERLEQLARRAEPVDRGLQWLWGSRSFMPGWCNGSAGFVSLWTEAYRTLGDSRYLALAEGAAWSTWESPSSLPSLCCGLPGQAYALLNIFRQTGDKAWLRRAERLADAAAEACVSSWSKPSAGASELHIESLYYGITATAILAAEIERPLEARMPFFERE